MVASLILYCVCAIHSNVLISPTGYDTSWTGGSGEGVHMRLNKGKKSNQERRCTSRSESQMQQSIRALCVSTWLFKGQVFP